MSITGSIVVYVMIWWIVFFALLPIDVNRNKNKKIEGEDSGSPENPKILKKLDRKSTRLNSSHSQQSRMPSSA